MRTPVAGPEIDAIMMTTRVLVTVCTLLAFNGCNYVGTVVKQRYYQAQLSHAPRNRIYKHLLDRDTYFVFGRVETRMASAAAATATAVVAISDFPVPGEVVDTSHFVRTESFYGLNLPEGEYRLLLVHDTNGDGVFTADEASAERVLRVDATQAPEKVVPNFNLAENTVRDPSAKDAFRIPVPQPTALADSVFYPKGTIRSLADPIFDPAMAEMGLYEPAAFMEAAPMMFYALEEDRGYKVPVIFVHGIGGSAREFADVVAQLDLTRYRPWFFHYPSGGDLAQLGVMFYEIFLSGNTVPRQQTPLVIVAHSMGGLVARDALNHLRGNDRESPVASLITLASPLGGHDAARRATHAPVVIPSWRNLDPASAFIRDLHRRPLSPEITYHLFSASGVSADGSSSSGSDGVVALTSQLDARATAEAQEQRDFAVSHTGILHDPAAVAALVNTIEETKSPFPADHLAAFDRGGFALPPGHDFTPLETYLVSELGHYMEALATGEIQPTQLGEQQFVEEIARRRRPELPASVAWLKFQALRSASADEAR